MTSKQDNTATSALVEIILMVAVSVMLVVLASSFVFEIEQENDPVDATVIMEQEGGQVTASLFRQSNLETVRIEGPNGETKNLSSVGDSVSLSDGNGQYRAVGVTRAGNEKVLVTKTIEGMP